MSGAKNESDHASNEALINKSQSAKVSRQHPVLMYTVTFARSHG